MVQDGGEKPKPLTPGTDSCELWRIQDLGQARFYSWEQWKAERLRWRRLDFCAALGVELITSCGNCWRSASSSHMGVIMPRDDPHTWSWAADDSRRIMLHWKSPRATKLGVSFVSCFSHLASRISYLASRSSHLAQSKA